MVTILCVSGSQGTENVEVGMEVFFSAFGSHIRYSP